MEKNRAETKGLVLEYSVQGSQMIPWGFMGQSYVPQKFKIQVLVTNDGIQIDVPQPLNISTIIKAGVTGRNSSIVNHATKQYYSWARRPGLNRPAGKIQLEFTGLTRTIHNQLGRKYRASRKGMDLRIWLVNTESRYHSATGELLNLLLPASIYDLSARPRGLPASIELDYQMHGQAENLKVELKSITVLDKAGLWTPPKDYSSNLDRFGSPENKSKNGAREKNGNITGKSGAEEVGSGTELDGAKASASGLFSPFFATQGLLTTDYAAMLTQPFFDTLSDIVNALTSHLKTYTGDGLGGVHDIHIDFDWWKDVSPHLNFNGDDSPAVFEEILRRGWFAIQFISDPRRFTGSAEDPLIDYFEDVVSTVNGAEFEIKWHIRVFGSDGLSQFLEEDVLPSAPLELRIENPGLLTRIADMMAEMRSLGLTLNQQVYLLLMGWDDTLRQIFSEDMLETMGFPSIPGILPADRARELENIAFPTLTSPRLHTDVKEHTQREIMDLFSFRAWDFDTSIEFDNQGLIKGLDLTNGSRLEATMQLKKVYLDFSWETAPEDTALSIALLIVTLGASAALIREDGWGYMNGDDIEVGLDIRLATTEEDTLGFSVRVDENRTDMDLSYYLFSGGGSNPIMEFLSNPSFTDDILFSIAQAFMSLGDVFEGKLKEALAKAVKKFFKDGIVMWDKMWHLLGKPKGVVAPSSIFDRGLVLRGQLEEADPDFVVDTSLVQYNHAKHCTWVMSNSYLSSWANKIVGNLVGEAMVNDLNWLGGLVADLPNDLSTLTIPSGCQAQENESRERSRETRLRNQFEGNWIGLSPPEMVTMADFRPPASSSTRYEIRTVIVRSRPEVTFYETGPTDEAGRLHMEYQVLVQAVRTSYQQTLMGVRPGRCHLVRAGQIPGLGMPPQPPVPIPGIDFTLSGTMTGFTREVSAARTGRDAETPGTIAQDRGSARGEIRTTGHFESIPEYRSGRGHLYISYPDLERATIERIPNIPEFGGGDGFMVCSPPEPIWKEEEIVCPLETFIDARVVAEARMFLGYTDSYINLLPQVGYGMGFIEVGDYTAEINGVESWNASSVQGNVQNLVLEDFQRLKDDKFSYAFLTPDSKVRKVYDNQLGLAAGLSTGAAHEILDIINGLAKLEEQRTDGRSYMVDGRHLYWGSSVGSTLPDLLNN